MCLVLLITSEDLMLGAELLKIVLAGRKAVRRMTYTSPASLV